MGLANAFQSVYILIWDLGLSAYNLVTPNLKVGSVVPKDCAGFGGKWPEYIPPKEGDSRSSCPALNALANHGILPRDGQNIHFTEMQKAVRETYNFSPSFCLFVPSFTADMLKKDFHKDTFNLADIDLHNGIEHDASLTRQDVYFQRDQSKPHIPYVEELLAISDGKTLTAKNLSDYSSVRRVESRKSNPEFSLDLFHKMFGSSNSSTLLTIFGGKVDDLRSILIEERIPDGWESRVRTRKGLTFATFNSTVLKVEHGINESKVEGSET